MVWTKRRGGSTSSTSPSPSNPLASAPPISIRAPGVHADRTPAPKLYLLLISGSVIASQRRSGVVLM